MNASLNSRPLHIWMLLVTYAISGIWLLLPWLHPQEGFYANQMVFLFGPPIRWDFLTELAFGFAVPICCLLFAIALYLNKSWCRVFIFPILAYLPLRIIDPLLNLAVQPLLLYLGSFVVNIWAVVATRRHFNSLYSSNLLQQPIPLQRVTKAVLVFCLLVGLHLLLIASFAGTIVFQLTSIPAVAVGLYRDLAPGWGILSLKEPTGPGYVVVVLCWGLVHGLLAFAITAPTKGGKRDVRTRP
jgi:hypothetical protein